MLARQIEAGPLEKFDVETQRIIGGRRVNAVRPETLVQRAHLKGEPVVEHQARDPVVILLQRDFPHAKITGGRIHDLFAILQSNPQVIKKRICLLYTSPSPRDRQKSRMPSS